MDALTGLLDGPRARGAFLLRTVLEPPWSLRVQDRAPLSVVAVVRGDGWLMPDGAPPVRLRTGDVAVLRGPEAYGLADDPATPVQAVVHPGETSTTPDGVELCDQWCRGVRTWGSGPDGPVVLLSGTYQVDGEVSRRLLSALPQWLVVPRSDLPVVPLLAEEVTRDLPGQEAVLDRLLDLLLISVLRAWFCRPEANPPAWYSAHADPVVGRALHLLHADPAHPWTVGSLADAVGASRASLARRFTELVGEPPMAYLTDWRLSLAADLLREPSATVASVARQVGYSTAFALSTAFKRERGVSPSEHRAR
ncbi:AraC family transcriptional regulator [Saccharothrix longispora]|uniref:AraC-like DNA-binding protein n=1 Tax=Saccharothrix longispora TaxID=33920 RepID=A0ABU1Q775_9PSEU|nr:AraC family transcriptional regulator [Saccharothrix longispora]MDR6598742.1 AraC-like DNA-binding protein [Saccharothrix longispora]